jgi:cellulose synthase/poly-beta-1,6-N-acetylglucosamine synthase-like glycosyltransferase
MAVDVTIGASMTSATPPVTVSVVLETDSVHPSDTLTLADCLEALAAQDYPAERIDLVVVDGGKVPELAALVRRRFPAARIVDCPGGTKFEQKNVGTKAARGDIVAFLDADCATPPHWLSTVVEELAGAPADVAGVQGVTELARGALSREVSALLYGIRASRGGDAERLVTDNLAFRREVFGRFGFEHASFGTAVDSLLLHRLRRAGYRVRLCDRLRMVHGYPDSWRVGLPWFFLRAWAVGYFMVRTRQLEPELPGSALVRTAGLGWPLIAGAKLVRDVRQIWQHRRRVGARLAVAVPITLAFEAALFLGGLGALARLPAPRIS